MKSLVLKRDKSILINLSKNVFSLPRKWQDENHYFLLASLGYNNIKNSNPDFDFQRFIIKTDYFFPKMLNGLFFPKNAINS